MTGGDATPVDARAGTGRVLVLLAALLVAMPWSFASMGPLAPLMPTAALVLGLVAVLHPRLPVTTPRVRRVATLATAALVAAGVLASAGRLALVGGPVGSPGWAVVLAGYAVLALAAATAGSRPGRRGALVFAALLAVHTVLLLAFLRLAHPDIDVLVYLREGVAGLLHGHDPYAMTYPNPYDAGESAAYLGPGIAVGDRLVYGFPYLPATLLADVPGWLVGDVRVAHALALTALAVVLRRLADDDLGRRLTLLAVAGPTSVTLVSTGWTEAVVMLAVGLLVLGLRRPRTVLVALGVGLLLSSKQYAVVLVPLAGVVWHRARTGLLAGVGGAAVLVLAFVAWDPRAFWRSVVELQLLQPVRHDTTSLLLSAVDAFGWLPPATYGVLPIVAGVLVAAVVARRAPRTPTAVALGIGLSLLATVLLSKQAPENYYDLVTVALLVGAIAWPTDQAGRSAQAADSSRAVDAGRQSGQRPLSSA